jgi:hypothetical protein
VGGTTVGQDAVPTSPNGSQDRPDDGGPILRILSILSKTATCGFLASGSADPPPQGPGRRFELQTVPLPRQSLAVTTIVRLDASNRVVLPRDLRRAAGLPRGQKLKASATPGRIVLEVEPLPHGKIVKRGRLKLWTGPVPATPLAEAVEGARHYRR